MNTDRVIKDRNAGGGGIIRNIAGEHMLNFFNFFGKGTRNMEETKALLERILASRELNIMDGQIRTDSRLLVGWIRKEFKIAWHIRGGRGRYLY